MTAKTQTPRLITARRILVVDDDPTNRWLTHRQLVLLGQNVDVAENGEAAFDMLRASRYDLLLTDCHMPRMDGVALTMAVRAAADPILRALPIIGVTADVTVAQSERCQQAGMSDVAIKPLNRDRLAQLLSRHLPHAPAIVPELQPSAPSPHRDTVLFDDQTYRDLFMPGDPEGKAWLMAYLDGAEHMHEELTRLLTIDEGAMIPREDFAATAHRLVGSSLTVGAVSLSVAARRLQQAVATEDRTSLAEWLTTSHNELINTRRAMETFVTAFQVEESS